MDHQTRIACDTLTMPAPMRGVMGGPSALEAKRHLCQLRVTLDGHPAIIGGAAMDFAGVWRQDGKGGAVELAWETVARIVAKGGAFQS